ncbi:hypothetical protein L227DRAFT_617510 [Lentinus tigrinus ALCF2SS1-6]|uniref:Uncharacterized protein n=1 Tax=Lentinus tigrinus ALCF2SS1-6 TaxID=1328759 RepID=A0A5C2RQP4_9APHY|nr:hypothetical protein L227DRAFT_617510 [Lentinus tigrinus ALCF2SS1-6]
MSHTVLMIWKLRTITFVDSTRVSFQSTSCIRYQGIPPRRQSPRTHAPESGSRGSAHAYTTRSHRPSPATHAPSNSEHDRPQPVPLASVEHVKKGLVALEKLVDAQNVEQEAHAARRSYDCSTTIYIQAGIVVQKSIDNISVFEEESTDSACRESVASVREEQASAAKNALEAPADERQREMSKAEE